MTNYYSYSQIKSDYQSYEQIADSIQNRLSPEESKIEYEKLLACWYKQANNCLDKSLKIEDLEDNISELEDTETAYNNLLKKTQDKTNEIESAYIKIRNVVDELPPAAYEFLSKFFYDEIGRIL